VCKGEVAVRTRLSIADGAHRVVGWVILLCCSGHLDELVDE